jgi:hypothetical protein
MLQNRPLAAVPAAIRQRLGADPAERNNMIQCRWLGAAPAAIHQRLGIWAAFQSLHKTASKPTPKYKARSVTVYSWKL